MKKVWSREIHLLSNSIKSRFWLIERLKTLGCNVDLSSDSWKTEGDFDVQRSEPVQQEVGVVDSSRRSPVVTLPKISEVEAGFLVKIEEVLRSSFTDSVAPGYIAKIQEADLEEVERLCERLTMLGYLEAHRQIGMVKYSISSAGRQSLREASS